MPDGDRFERTLFGKGWRKAYRLACGNESLTPLGDVLMKAAETALNGPLACATLTKIRDAVYNALQEKARSRMLNFGDRPLADPYRQLSEGLIEIVAADASAMSTQLAAKAAQSVYLEFHLQRAAVTSEQIESRLSELFVEKVIRYQWLARVREGVVLKTDRSVEDQMSWEERLFIHLAKPSREMLKKVFRSDGAVKIRAPRRQTPQRKMTIEELHQGLTVLEG
jgi:hypothetical protein